MRQPTRYPGRIIVTDDRARRDMGNLRNLAKSIDRDGLLQPLVVTSDGRLVAGARRLAAWRLLGREESPIPVHVVDVDAIARGEWAENTYREDLTWSERVRLVRMLRPALQEAARERQRVLGRRHGKPLEDPSAQIAPEGRTRDLIARGLGISARSFDKAEAIVVAAEERPGDARIAGLLEAMDRTGQVHAPYQRLRVIRQAEVIRAEPPPIPGRGPYRVLVTDFPWPYDAESEDQSERAITGYPLMTMAEILALPLRELAHEDCAWWCWCTNHVLLRGDLHRALAHFGFRPSIILTWAKDRHGQGKYLLGQTEHCVLAIRGRPTIVGGQATTLLTAPRRAPSEKPREFYALVERVTPAAAYCELYPHRQPPRLGWDRNYIGTPAALPADEAPPAEPAIDVHAEPPRPYRVPSGRTIQDLVPIGSLVRTNYGTGPYVVTDLAGPHVTRMDDGRRYEHWTIVGSEPAPPGRRRSSPFWLNDLVAVDGRILNLETADEVFVEAAAAPDLARAAS